MKLTATFLLLLLAGRLSAQRLTGLLMGDLTRMPLAHATVSAGNVSVQSNAYGIFSINNAKPADSLRIICAGYAYYAFKPVYTNKSDTLVIYLQPMSYVLNEVVIKSSRNFKADSARTRRDFAKIFAYKAPTAADVMIKHDPGIYVPYNYIDAPNNTTAIAGFDVLRLISFLSKKKDTKTRLQQKLIKDEADNYVDHSFSKQKITTLTPLKGDSLNTFMDRYRPSPAQVKKMSDYEMVLYIKKCYGEFSNPAKR